MATYKTIEKIPTWSLGYLINGDSTGLTDEEIALADQWSKDTKAEVISPHTDIEGNMQPYFTHVPAFGLPTEVEDCTLICREEIKTSTYTRQQYESTSRRHYS